MQQTLSQPGFFGTIIGSREREPDFRSAAEEIAKAIGLAVHKRVITHDSTTNVPPSLPKLTN